MLKENQRQKPIRASWEVQRDAMDLRNKLEDAEAEVQRASTEKQRVSAEHEEVERNRARQLGELTRARLELTDEQMRAKDALKTQEELKSEAARLGAESEKLTQELETLRPELAVESDRRAQLLQRKQICEAQRGQLLAKQGRSSQYSSVAQRNKALREEVGQRKARKERAAAELKEVRNAQKENQVRCLIGCWIW